MGSVRPPHNSITMKTETTNRTIPTCSAIKGDSDYKYVGLCYVHRKALRDLFYRECGDFFEVFYLGKWRSAFKKDFVINN